MWTSSISLLALAFGLVAVHVWSMSDCASADSSCAAESAANPSMDNQQASKSTQGGNFIQKQKKSFTDMNLSDAGDSIIGSTANCLSACADSTNSWAKKCTWKKKCGGCPDCAVTCLHWCTTHTDVWANKCTWKGCVACDPCGEDDDPPPPTYSFAGFDGATCPQGTSLVDTEAECRAVAGTAGWAPYQWISAAHPSYPDFTAAFSDESGWFPLGCWIQRAGPDAGQVTPGHYVDTYFNTATKTNTNQSPYGHLGVVCKQ